MSKVARKRGIIATEGPIFSKIILFAIPLILTNLIQQLYTIADNLVVGKFSTDPTALGAIGSSMSLVAFLTALFAGFSIGASATVSHDFGARDRDALSKSVHSSLILSLIAGLLVGAIGFIFAEPLLLLMNTKEEFLSGAVTYLRIRCVGMPLVSLYSVAAAILRSVGDSKSPMYILTCSGIANVFMNLVFVLLFGMGADGVAYATLIAQVLSVIFLIAVLLKRKDEDYSISYSDLRIDLPTTKRIMGFAIPGTIQGSVAHVMNLLLSTATNSFSPEVVEARTVASNIDNIMSTVIAVFASVTITFVGQNRGAVKPDRIKRSLLYSILQSTALAVFGCIVFLAFKDPLISLFLNESSYDVESITAYAGTIIVIIQLGYLITGLSNSLAGFIKGMGYALPTMLISLFDMGVVRAIWILLLFPMVNTLEFLYLIYPVSWTLSAVSYSVVSIFIWKKYKRKLNAMTSSEPATIQPESGKCKA